MVTTHPVRTVAVYQMVMVTVVMESVVPVMIILMMELATVMVM